MKYILLLCLIPLTTFGRLGETFMECEARYGPCLRLPSGDPKQSTILDKNAAQAEWDYEGFHLVIAWLPPEGAEGPADIFMIQNPKGGMTDQQVQAILDANSNGLKWKKGSRRDIVEQLKKQGNANPLFALSSAIVTNLIPFQKAYYREDGAEALPIYNSVKIKSPRLVQQEIEEEIRTAAEKEKIPKL